MKIDFSIISCKLCVFFLEGKKVLLFEVAFQTICNYISTLLGGVLKHVRNVSAKN